MVFIFILTGALLLSAFIFILIEYPYYLVSVFAFLHLYNVNLELPGPLDLRGLLSIAIFIRLVVFDKKNIGLINELISNKFFSLILLFNLYTGIVYFLTGSSISIITRFLLLNFIALLVGYLTIRRGYGIKTIVLAFIITGIFCTGDLIFSFLFKGKKYIKRIVDYLLNNPTLLNHNFFGVMCGQALIIVFLLLIYKKMKKVPAYILITILSLGILMSTSRMAFLSVIVTLLFLFIIQREFKINFKKVLAFGFMGAIIFIIVLFSFSYILSSMNIETEFAEYLQYRLVEEPLSFLNEDSQQFEGNRKVQGSIRWRMDKTFRDADVFLQQNNSEILFGFGQGGYFKIGLVQFKGGTRESFQYAAHNFYTNLVSEIGIVGLLLFLMFFLPLIYSGLKRIKKGKLHFSYIFIILFMFIYSIGSEPDLTGTVAYILFGCVIAEFMEAEYHDYLEPKGKLKSC